MPTYTYGCKSCGHEFDVFHSMSATPEIKCESCDSAKTERHLGTGGGIIFKGSGFYETDFKGKRGSKGGGDSKSETKTESTTKTGESKGGETKAACGGGCACHSGSKN